MDSGTHRIIEGAAFGPEVLRAAGKAFEAAWREIAHRFDAASREAARELLAAAIISAARADSTDAETLRQAGLRAMARAFPATVAPLHVDKIQRKEG